MTIPTLRAAESGAHGHPMHEPDPSSVVLVVRCTHSPGRVVAAVGMVIGCTPGHGTGSSQSPAEERATSPRAGTPRLGRGRARGRREGAGVAQAEPRGRPSLRRRIAERTRQPDRASPCRRTAERVGARAPRAACGSPAPDRRAASGSRASSGLRIGSRGSPAPIAAGQRARPPRIAAGQRLAPRPRPGRALRSLVTSNEPRRASSAGKRCLSAGRARAWPGTGRSGRGRSSRPKRRRASTRDTGRRSPTRPR